MFKILEDFKHFPQNKISDGLYAEMEKCDFKKKDGLKTEAFSQKFLKKITEI